MALTAFDSTLYSQETIGEEGGMQIRFATSDNVDFIKKASVLSSLSLLSRKSNTVWIKQLLKEVLLSPTTLHCIFRLLTRVPEAGSYIRRLVFVDLLHSLVSRTHLSVSDLEKGHLDVNPIELMTQGLSQTKVEGSQSLSSLHTFFSKDSRIVDDDCKKPKHLDLHKHQISTALALITESAPNLEMVEVKGYLQFPFVIDLKPLQGLVNLKEIKLKRTNRFPGTIVNAQNLIWLLTLPNLKKASLCVDVDKKDAKFLLKDHGEILSQGISRVERLDMFISPKVSSIGDCLKMILSSIVGLQHLKVKIDGKCNVGQILEGLKKHSVESLLSLSIKIGAPVDPYNVKGPSLNLKLFSKLSQIQSDGNLIYSLFIELQKSSGEDEEPQLLPPVLGSWKVLLSVSGKMGNVLMGIASEEVMEEIISHVHLPSTFHTIISVVPETLEDSPVDFEGKIAQILRFKEVCGRQGLQLKVAEPEFDELY